MRGINWVIQNNLIKKETLEALRKAFQENNLSFEEVFVIPFSQELPEIRHTAAFNIFYGSTTLMLNAFHHPTYTEGVFYNPKDFQMATYLSRWKDHLLNSDGLVTSFGNFIKSTYDQDSNWFIRPNADTKTFSGRVMSFSQIKAWGEQIVGSNDIELSLESLVFVSSPKKIDKEWRNFIVDGKVISSSRYLVGGELNVSPNDIPSDMIDFVHDRCQEFTPHQIFVMDVSLFEKKYYILECNCFNGTGFYANDISKIIKAISKAVEAKIR
jgi:hypothetical protein